MSLIASAETSQGLGSPQQSSGSPVVGSPVDDELVTSPLLLTLRSPVDAVVVASPLELTLPALVLAPLVEVVGGPWVAVEVRAVPPPSRS